MRLRVVACRRVRGPRERGTGAGAARDAADRDPVRGRPYAADPVGRRRGARQRLRRPHGRERRPGRRHVSGAGLPVHVPRASPSRRRWSSSSCACPAGETCGVPGLRRGAMLERVSAGGRQRRVDAGGPGRPRRQRDDPAASRARRCRAAARSTSTTWRSRRCASPARRSPASTHFAAGVPVTFDAASPAAWRRRRSRARSTARRSRPARARTRRPGSRAARTRWR